MAQIHDVIVIGAGFAGLYAVHKMRDELKLEVKGFDAAGGPGGVWWWNGYPGARCDIDSVHYCYSFSDEIQREWQWSEKFAGQPELKAYFEFVDKKLDLSRSFSFNTRVTSTTWDEGTKRWTVTTDSGETHTARFVLAATGNLSIPKRMEYEGKEDFEGEIYETATWPHHKIDFAGKRVAVIGTGASGVQVIQTIAPEVKHLTVFQRTANFCTPLGNHPIEPEKRKWMAENHAEIRAGSREHPFGIPYEMPRLSSHMDSAEERKARYDQMIKGGGLRLIGAAYADVIFDESSNEMLAGYVRDHIASRVKDPEKLRKLMPTDHHYGTKRPPLETKYFEVYNQENVEIVALKEEPILRFTKTGIVTEKGEYPLDMVIMATGFDALTGSWLKLNITGRNGYKLSDAWSNGPRNLFGLAVHGFPNLFTITGPTAAGALYNNPLAIEDHVDLATKAIQQCLEKGATTFEASQAAQDRWAQIAHDLLHLTLFPKTDSWYMGSNIDGKPRATNIFVAPAPLYRAFTGTCAAMGFAGFETDGVAPPLPPILQLDAEMSMVVGGAIIEGAKPIEASSVDEIRASIEHTATLQGPPRDVAVTETTYPGGEGQAQAARIYRPHIEGSLPALVFFHGGGFVAGSLDAFDSRCRALAADLGVVVIAPSYRLAPEHPFPAAVHDSYAAVKWAAEVAESYDADPDRLIVSGESAGGTLAAIAALRARDENGPDIAAQILVTPAIEGDAQTQSRKEYAHAPILGTAALEHLWSLYIQNPEDAASPLAAPGNAKSVADLPATLILTAEIDPLRDEAEAYGERLRKAGVVVDMHRVEGVLHASFGMEGRVRKAREYTLAMDKFIKHHLAHVKVKEFA